MLFHSPHSTNEAPAKDTEFSVASEETNPSDSHHDLKKSKDVSPADQDSSLDTSEQALLCDLPMERGKAISRSEPDLSSVTTKMEKPTESTTIMIDIQDSAVVQSEELSFFLLHRKS